jgi:immunity protein 8 of polymorphic toxin system
MIKVIPELKSLSSPDLGRGQEPADPSDAAVMVEAGIGPKGKEETEKFSFVAITPRALSRDQGVRWGRGYLILDRISWSTVESAVQQLISRCAAESWEAVTNRLGREMHREFENDQEKGGTDA